MKIIELELNEVTGGKLSDKNKAIIAGASVIGTLVLCAGLTVLLYFGFRKGGLFRSRTESVVPDTRQPVTGDNVVDIMGYIDDKKTIPAKSIGHLRTVVKGSSTNYMNRILYFTSSLDTKLITGNPIEYLGTTFFDYVLVGAVEASDNVRYAVWYVEDVGKCYLLIFDIASIAT